MDQTLRVDLIMIIGTKPRRTLRLSRQKIELNKLEKPNSKHSPSHCPSIRAETNHCPT
jgi:hypothetical protein